LCCLPLWQVREQVNSETVDLSSPQASPEAIPQLEEICRPDMRFKDPFKDVRSVKDYQKILTHMYSQVEEPKFVSLDKAFSGDLIIADSDMDYDANRIENDFQLKQCLAACNYALFSTKTINSSLEIASIPVLLRRDSGFPATLLLFCLIALQYK
jgi:hypothetical protein